MALAEDKVREALKQVIDPELFVNIVDLGLIYVVAVGEEKEDGRHDVNIEMDYDQPHVSRLGRNWLRARRAPQKVSTKLTPAK